MKKLLKYLLISPIILLLIVIGFVLTIDPTRLAPLIQEQLAERGIEAKFGGKIAWQFFPEFGLRVQNLELASLKKEKMGTRPLAQIGEVGFAVAVKPLFQRQIHVTGVNLENAELYLLVDARGQNNWSTHTDTSTEDASDSGEEKAADLPQLKIEKFDVRNLQLVYDDLQTDSQVQLQDLNMHSRNTNIDGQSFPLALRFGLKLPDVPLLQTELNTDLAFNLENLKTEAKSIKARFAAFNQKKQIANIHMDGEIAHLPQGETSKQIVKLHFDALDLDTLLPTLSSEPTAETDTEERPLPLKLLRNLNNEVDVRLDQLKVADIQVENIALLLNSKNGLIDIKKLEAEVFEGKLQATGKVDANQNSLTAKLDGAANGINVGKAIKDFSDSDYLAGSTHTQFTVNASGASVNALIDNLVVDSKTRAQSLILQPINIEQQYCRILAMLDEKGAAKTLLDSTNWPPMTELEPVEILASYEKSKLKMSKLEASISTLLTNASGVFNLESGEFDFPISVSLKNLDTGKNSCLNIDEKWLNHSLPLRCKGNLSSIGAKTCLPDTHLIGDILKKNLKDKADAKLDEEKARLKEKAEAEKRRANARLQAEKERLAAEKKKREQELEKKKKEAEEKAKSRLDKELKDLVDKLDSK